MRTAGAGAAAAGVRTGVADSRAAGSVVAPPMTQPSWIGAPGPGAEAHAAGVKGFLTLPVKSVLRRACIVEVLGGGPREELVTRHTIAEVQARRRDRVLLVEANPVNQKLAVRMLETIGLRVDVAGDGAEAVAAVARQKYALVQMDCRMPVMERYDAARAIRAAERDRARIPIVAATANALDSDRERSLEAGVDDYLAKPFRTPELARVIERCVDRDRRGADERLASASIPTRD